MLKRVLFVDDEFNVLRAFERQFRKRFDLRTAHGPEEALQALSSKGPFSVVVSDLCMPVMNGIEFLARVRRNAPDTVRIMLTGQADLSAAIAAVNRGDIFQFLTKPCPSEMLVRALESAFEQYRLITAERELLEQTLRGSIGVLSEILSLVNAPAFSRAHRVRRYVRCMAETLALPDQWQYDLAAMLSQIGCVAVPPEILERAQAGLRLSAEETQVLSSQYLVGHNLLARIPRLEMVARMVANQRTARPSLAEGVDAAVIGAHLLKIALDFDEQLVNGETVNAALAAMHRRGEYNTAFLHALERVQVEQEQSQTRLVNISQLRPRMIADSDIRANTGVLLLAKGQEISESAVARLKSFVLTVGVVEPVRVVARELESSETAHGTSIVAGVFEGVTS